MKRYCALNYCRYIILTLFLTYLPTPALMAQNSPPSSAESNKTANNYSANDVSISFNNVAIIEYIRFISRISGKNFIFDDQDLQFNVTIVTEEATSIANLMSALLQELRIRDLSLIEQGNNIIIHRNAAVRAPARIVSEGEGVISSRESELVTRIFRLNALDPQQASEIIKPLLSDSALVEVLRNTNTIVITDLVTTINKIAQLISSLDAPNSGVTMGQYVVRNGFADSLIDVVVRLLQPIAQGNPFTLVPNSPTNSIFIVSNPFIVEKALAILENIDSNTATNQTISIENLRPSNKPFRASGVGPNGEPGEGFENLPQRPNLENLPGRPGRPGTLESSDAPFSPDIFDESHNFMPGELSPASQWSEGIPLGRVERTLFEIYKLHYRRGDQIEIALRKIANSLRLTGSANVDLVSAINSTQWIESSNALIFTGTASAIGQVKHLVTELDTPLRQVFIEMLILEANVVDALSYGVEWDTIFGGGSVIGAQNYAGLGGLLTTAANAIANTDVGAGADVANIIADASSVPAQTPQLLFGNSGYTANIIGTHLTHHGTRFNSIGALIKAIHTNSKTRILMNPKIVVEDNTTAEVFVGGVDRYKTQSLSNDLGSIITNNFQFMDVGTLLRVTPLISNDGVITLDILQETTNQEPTANTGNINQVDVNLVRVLSKTRTVTKVHVPNGFFVILSGMIEDQEIRAIDRIPCLGGIPIIGGAANSKANGDNKRNLMLFIRPLIVDTEKELEDITKRQQDVFREKSKFRRLWNYEIDEALDQFALKPTDPDEIGCDEG